jgi:hypothetical protein
MYHIHLEELESRQLLNRSSILPESVQAQVVIVTTYSIGLGERAIIVELINYTTSFTASGSSEARFANDSWRDLPRGGYDGGDAGGYSFRSPAHSGPGDPKLPPSGSGASSDVPGTIPNPVQNPDSARTIPAATSPVLPNQANSNRIQNSVSPAVLVGLPVERLNPPARSLFEYPLSARSLTIEMQDRPTLPTPLGTVRGDEAGLRSRDPGNDNWTSPNQSGASATPPAEENLVVPLPLVADVLSALPPLDLSALEAGMQQFLGQLRELGPRLAGDVEGTSVWPWVIAVAAAASACEIARRELKRSAALPALEAHGWPE